MRPPPPSEDEIAPMPHRTEPGASESMAMGAEARENPTPQNNEIPRHSFSATRPLFSPKNMVIAHLAIQHLQGENPDLANAQSSARIHRISDLTPEQLLSAAMDVAEGPIGQYAKQHLNPDNYSLAWNIIASKLQSADYENRLKQELEAERERYGPYPILGKLLEKIRQWASDAMERLATVPDMPSPPAPPPPEKKQSDNKTTGIPSAPPPGNLPPANRYSPEEW